MQFTQPRGPWKTFSVLACNGQILARVRRIRAGEWVLTDLGRTAEFDSSFPLVKGKTQVKAFARKYEAINFIFKHYSK